MPQQDAKASVADPAHVPTKDRPEATFLPGLIADFLRTLKDIVPAADGEHRSVHIGLHNHSASQSGGQAEFP